jgi:SAM-dependent methyltransferase
MTEQRGTATFRTPAEAYDRHIGRYGPELARALCDAAGVLPGATAIDVGCGPGALTTELVARLGAVRVAAADPSQPFAEACRARHPGVQVEVAPGEALPFPDGAFGHALAQLVVNFMADPLAGVREMARVTRVGGTVAAAVWDYAGGMVLLRRFWDAAVALDPAAERLDEGRSMPFCTHDALLALWREAGLADARVQAAEAGAEYDGFDDLWTALEHGAGPASAYASGLDRAARSALREELRGRLGAPDGPFRLTARAWIATGVQHRIQPIR